MKKILPVAAIAVILVGALGFFAGSRMGKGTDTEKEITVEKTVNQNDNKKISNYAADLEERMKNLKKEKEPMFSGTTADMRNAANEMEEAWEKEMGVLYDLLMAELPENEKEKLREAQEEWKKKVEANVEKSLKEAESDGGSIEPVLESGSRAASAEERAMELAKMYDELHK